MITTERIQAIASMALDLWASFTRTHEFTAKQWINPEPHLAIRSHLAVNYGVVEFSRHCGDAIGANVTIVFASIPVLDSAEGNSGVATWLFRRNKTDYAIVIDPRVIEKSLQRGDIRDRSQAITRLILKQVGTLVLNTKFHAENQDAEPTNQQSPEQEEEAWVFCGTVLGLALGANAQSSRQQNVIDQAWTRSC